MLAEIQAAFRASLLDPAAPVPESVTSHSADGPGRGYSVHRHNVVLGLIGALRSRFPATVRVLGEECFKELARRYVREQPPRSPVLLNYGDHFPTFVDGFEPALGLPYLTDLMRLEVAWSQAFHAADAEPVTAEALASLVPETVSDTKVTIHPAARLVRSAHPVATLWEMNVEGGEPGPIDVWSGEDVLVTRPKFAVLVHRLPPGAFEFIESLMAGHALAEAVEAAFGAAETFDPAAALAGLVSVGLSIRFHR